MVQNQRAASNSLKVCWTLFYRFRNFSIEQHSTVHKHVELIAQNGQCEQYKGKISKRRRKRGKKTRIKKRRWTNNTQSEIRSLTVLNDQWLKGWQKSLNWISSCSVQSVFCLFLKRKRAHFAWLLFRCNRSLLELLPLLSLWSLCSLFSLIRIAMLKVLPMLLLLHPQPCFHSSAASIVVVGTNRLQISYRC